MYWELRKETNPVAQKDYHCQASDWIDNTKGWNELEYDEEDRAILSQAKAEDCRILKGTRYIKVEGKWEGEFDVFRAREDLHHLCVKYELYPE